MPALKKRKKRIGTNPYMYWCNQMNMRKTVVADLSDAAGKVDMKEVVAELGRRWRALPADSKQKVELQCKAYVESKKKEENADVAT